MSIIHKKPSRAQRLERRMSSRPWLTLTTVATAATILGMAAGAVTWIVGYFETADRARQTQIENMRRDAWSSYAIQDIRRAIARNRVWECDAKKQRQKSDPMVPAEIAACNQHQRDLDAAEVRANQLLNEAIALGKER